MNNYSNEMPATSNGGLIRAVQYYVTPFNSRAQQHCEEEFIEAMRQAGINFQGKINADCKIHRFANDGRSNKDCWYVFFGMAGAFGDWSRDIHQKWSIQNHELSSLDHERRHQQIEQAQRTLEEERRRGHEEAANKALALWTSYADQGASQYLSRKKVEGFGLRFHEETVVVPAKDVDGKLWSLQYISSDGTKRFLSRGRKKGCFHAIGELRDGAPVFVVEGYATGASIYMTTGNPVAIAFDAGNLESVIGELKKAYPRSPILIAGDDDQWKDHNTGRITAEEIARNHGCKVVFPAFKDIHTQPTDFNDLMLLEGKDEVYRQINATLQEKILKAVSINELLTLELPPRRMILNPIIPEQGLVMIHAPRGIGKTHISLMIAYTVATGNQMFAGRWTSENPNKVLFVDGEMPLTVMQERLAKIVSSSESIINPENNLQLITPDLQHRGIPDLSILEGQKAIEEHLKDVKLLILDNYSSLCRSGRENEAESWLPLQEWLLDLRRRGISVLLIHHSNKTGGQRGTSRKEDILDTVITLRKPENYDPREGARFEVHYEKARGFYGEEASPFEASLKEENDKSIWNIKEIETSQMGKIIELQKEGLPQRIIAKETGVSSSTVNRRLKEAKERGLINE